VRVGEPVSFVLRIENRAERTLDVYLRGRTITVDVVVAGEGGEVVWRRLEDEIIPAIALLRTLAPRERVEVGVVWDQRTRQGRQVQPGDYTARAFLLVEGGTLETAAASFQIAR
jgi:hypothetical protein